MSLFQDIFSKIEQGEAAYFEKDIVMRDGSLFHIRRRFLPPQRLILLGGGHVAKAVSEFADKVEFDIVVVDDRPDFANPIRFPEAKRTICDSFEKAIEALQISSYDYVAVLTRGHKHDADCLRKVLTGNMPFYLGLIGSRRRVSGLKNVLLEEGFDADRLESIHTPIGLSIGAATPSEIGISIVAELIQCRREKEKKDFDDDCLSQDNSDMELLQYLAYPEERTAYAIVVDTKGSTPVKSGAIMAVNRLGRIYGTIGGGCSEHAVMQEAFEVIDSGQSRVVNVDMTNDVAAMEGMVCGGTMEVYIDTLF